jgi:non-specific serine/threonine protein kinase/serine/threonine-protein kinase
VLGPNHINTLAAHSNIGLTLQSQGRLKEAEALQIEDLQQTRKALGPDHPATIDSLGNLAITYGMENKLLESEKMFRESYEISLRTLGPAAGTTRNQLSNLATTLAYEKRADESIAMFEKALAIASKLEGTALIDTHVEYAAALTVLGRLDPAIAHLREAAKLGFTNTQLLTSNDDLKQLRNDPRFQALVDEIQKKK